MIYFYDINLRFYKNDDVIFKRYIVSFIELLDFLNRIKARNSSMEIYSIKPYYGRIYYNQKRG